MALARISRLLAALQPQLPPSTDTMLYRHDGTILLSWLLTALGFNDASRRVRGFRLKTSGFFAHTEWFATGRCRLRRAWCSERRRAVASTKRAGRRGCAPSGPGVARGARL